MKRKVTYEFDNDELLILAEALDMLVAERTSKSYWVQVSYDEVQTAQSLVRIFKADEF